MSEADMAHIGGLATGSWIYLIISAIALNYQVTGHNINLVFSGELTLEQALTDELSKTQLETFNNEVLETISENINVPSKCLKLQASYRKSLENSSISLANYTATLDDRKCDISAQVITLENMSELGVETLHISPFVQSEFWQDRMNSILIFVGCGVIIVIVLVTCVILTTRCHLRFRPDHQGEAHMSSSNSSKQQLYHPYCIDTMTLDMSHKKHRRKDRSYSVNEHEPTTIQRWVNSQLKGKGKRTSQTVELDHDITKPSKGHLHPDVFTTDSGIVTTTPRTHRGSVYDVEEAKLSVATGQEGIYRRRSSFDEPLVTENVYERLESINYAQHDNDAYNSDNTPTHSPNAINLNDSYAGEQSSKL